MTKRAYLMFSARIKEAYHDLTKKERLVADCILQNPEWVLASTAEEIGAAANSSAATVIRLCRDCGFDGLADLKLALKKEYAVEKDEPSARYIGLREDNSASLIKQKVLGYHNMIVNTMLSDWNVEAYFMAVDAITAAKRILVLGEGGSRCSAINLFNMLMLLGLPAESYMDSVFEIMKVHSLEPGDVVIGLTYTGRLRNSVDSFQLARKNGITTIGIVGYLDAPIIEYTNIVLNTTSINQNYYDSELSIRISESVVIELLSSCLALRLKKAMEPTVGEEHVINIRRI